MKIVITSQPGLGHLTTLLPLGRELRRRGHEIVGAGSPSVTAAFRASGLPAETVCTEPMPSGDSRHNRLVPGLAAIPPTQRLALFRREVSVPSRALDLATGLLDFFTTHEPDLLIRESTELGGWVAAEKIGIPHVSLEVSMHWSEQDWDREAGDAIRRLRSAVGLTTGALAAAGMYRYLHLDNSPAILVNPEADLPQTRRLIRPTFLDGSEGTEIAGGRGHLYVAFGSIYQADWGALDSAIPILAGDFPEILISGPSRWPIPNVRTHPYVPQAAAMEGCSVVLCHGGRNTVLTALAAGVPLACVPLSSDNFAIAERVATANVGAACKWDSTEIVAATRLASSSSAIQAATRTVAAAIRDMPPLEDAANLIEELVPRAQTGSSRKDEP